MNKLEEQMTQVLVTLRKNFGVTEVKAEFEAEASRLNEVMRLKEIAVNAQVGLVIKIGGGEAITDMFMAQHIGVSGLIAPMIESSYAMKKYLEAVKIYFPEDLRQNIHFGVNIETFQAFQNLKEILNLPTINMIDTLTLGRVDLVGSLGLNRKDVNSNRILQIAESVFSLAREKGLRTTMGGAISVESIPFIEKLAKRKLLDRFETRKIVFNVLKKFNNIEKGILKAVEFEVLWLKNKRDYYSIIATEDNKRIQMIEERLATK